MDVINAGVHATVVIAVMVIVLVITSIGNYCPMFFLLCMLLKLWMIGIRRMFCVAIFKMYITPVVCVCYDCILRYQWYVRYAS